MPRASLTVTESARPDCPEGHVQLTRWDGSMPVGHTYADARGGWAAVAHEVRMQGFGASACVTVETDPPGIMPLAAVGGL